jgi:hypothetical protein
VQEGGRGVAKTTRRKKTSSDADGKAAVEDAVVVAAAETSTVDAPEKIPAVPAADDPSVQDRAPEAEVTPADDNPDDAADDRTIPLPDTTPPAPPARTGGFVPLVLGGLLAGGIGYAVPTFVAGNAADPLAPVMVRLDDLSARTDAIDAALSNLRAEVDAVEIPQMPDLAPVTAQIETLRADIAALRDRPAGDAGVTEGDLAALRDALAAQKEASAELGAELEAMAARQAAGLANAETEALTAARAAQAEAAAQTVIVALQTGAPYDTVIGDLDGTVPDALAAAAATGVPTADALKDPFPDLARQALAAAREGSADATTGAGRLTAFLQSQVGARSVEPREGTDPDAVLSRAEAAVRSGDFATALTELESLPDTAKAPLAGWIENARLRVKTTTALNDYLAAN